MIVDNLILRADYIKHVPCYDLDDLEASLLIDKSTVEEWRMRDRLFSISFDERRLFPQFQFSDGQPDPIIQSILRELPNDMSQWQIALWFYAGNAWLDGQAPQDCLVREKDLTQAARAEASEFVG